MLQRVCVVVLGGTLTCCLGGISWLWVFFRAGARCWVLRGRWPFGGFGFSVEPRALPVFAGGFWGVCFENFIVDASIFVVFVVGFLASYLVRSVDALAPRADEGRCNLR